MPGARPIAGLSALLDRHDAFIFDLWGVLHDGAHCMPGVLPALQQLRAAGKKIGIMSNSPRPAEAAAANIGRYGLRPDTYDLLLTSGQLTFEALRDRPDAWLRALGHDCLHIGPGHEFAFYAPLGLRKSDDPAAASFIFVTGVGGENAALEDFQPLLNECLHRRLPLLCANPDRAVLKEGRRRLAPGSIAQHYAAMGGDVRAGYGKPHPEIFTRMLRQLAVPATRALMIGDNLDTDIAGAHGVDMPSLWIYGGVHRPELTPEPDFNAVLAPGLLHDFLAHRAARPDYMLPQVVF